MQRICDENWQLDLANKGVLCYVCASEWKKQKKNDA